MFNVQCHLPDAATYIMSAILTYNIVVVSRLSLTDGISLRGLVAKRPLLLYQPSLHGRRVSGAWGLSP